MFEPVQVDLQGDGLHGEFSSRSLSLHFETTGAIRAGSTVAGRGLTVFGASVVIRSCAFFRASQL